ncbi:hypothetical protein ACLSYF_10970, partial [Avibacterium avium]
MLTLVFLSYLTVSGENTKKDNLKKLENMIYLLENQFGEVKKLKVEIHQRVTFYYLLSTLIIIRIIIINYFRLVLRK